MLRLLHGVHSQHSVPPYSNQVNCQSSVSLDSQRLDLVTVCEVCQAWLRKAAGWRQDVHQQSVKCP